MAVNPPGSDRKVDPPSDRGQSTLPSMHARLTLTASVYGDQVRAELHQWQPGDAPGGHLVWQHHNRADLSEQSAAQRATEIMEATAEWLVKCGWPGVR